MEKDKRQLNSYVLGDNYFLSLHHDSSSSFQSILNVSKMQFTSGSQLQLLQLLRNSSQSPGFAQNLPQLQSPDVRSGAFLP
jgi:hypothetical protein